MVTLSKEDTVDINLVANKLCDGLMWVEGVGRVEVDYLGLLEDTDAPSEGALS